MMHMQNKTTAQQKRVQGFTLVEVIVVLVILAILAAILIPSMTGWIDKSQEKRLITACRTCVTAAQTLASESYGTGRSVEPPKEADVVALAGVPGIVTGILVDQASASVNELTYTEGTDSVTYFRMQEPHYVFNGAGGSGAGAQAGSFTAFLNQHLNSGKLTVSKAELFSSYYASNPASIQMPNAYKQKLVDAGLNETIKAPLYWWTYPVTDAVGTVQYTVTYANTQSDAAFWNDSNRGRMNSGYVVIVNGKTYYRSNSGKTVEPGNSTNPYQTEDALEAALILNGYQVLN